MKRDWFHKLWFADTDARIYAAFRVVFAVVSLINLIHLSPYRYAFFADTGMVDLEAAHTETHFGFPHFSLFNVFTSELHVDVIFGISAIALVLLTFGIGGRATAFWVFIWHITVTNRSPVALAGWDDVLRVYSFLLLISPLGAQWPFRMKRVPSGTLDPAPVYGLNLMRLQLAVIYLHTGLCKFPDPAWQKGEVLTYYLMSINARFPTDWVVNIHPFLKLMTWSILAAEIIVPFLFFFRKTRLIGAVLGMSFHVGIFVLSKNLTMFPLAMLPAYLSLFDSKSFAWLLNKIRRKRPEQQVIEN